MSGIWYIIVPEATTNYVLNPSAEASGNYSVLIGGSASPSVSPSGSASPSASQSLSASRSASPSASVSPSPSASQSRSPSASSSPSGSASPSASPSSGTTGSVTRVLAYARHGIYCYEVTMGAANDGMSLTTAALTAADHYVSFYVRGTITGTLQVSLNSGANYTAAAAIGGSSAGWVRYGAAVASAQVTASGTELRIRDTSDDAVFYLDAIQVEANSYGTTYIDGSLPGGRWSGLYHASTSARDAQYRGGGREANLYDNYGIDVVEGTKRIGMPPVSQHILGKALQPGAEYQSEKVLPREIELHLNYSSDSWAGFHNKRSDVINLLKSDLVRGNQPIVLGYAGAGSSRRAYADFYYTGGLEFGDFMAYDEVATVGLLAPNPYWYADDNQTVALDFQNSIASAAYGLRRINGQWLALGTGFNGAVYAIAVDNNNGRIYFGGQFTTANGVTVNGVCYWDGTTAVAMGSGVSGGIVYALAIAPNGDLWVGGAFTSAGGSTSDGLARWNLSSSTWSQFTQGTPGDVFLALAIDESGKLYAGGNFTNWDGDASQDYITTYTGGFFSSLGSGANGEVQAIKIYGSKTYISGAFTTLNGVTVNRVCYWDGTTAVAMGSGANDEASCLAVDNVGNVYVGGVFTTMGGTSMAAVAKWNGNNWESLGSGNPGLVFALLWDGNALWALASTFFGDIDNRISVWNGYIWLPIDWLYSSGSPYDISGDNDKNVFIGLSDSITATVAGLTTVTNSGSTFVQPIITITGPTSSGTTCTLQWIENQSSGHRLYFNLTINAGETMTIDTDLGLVVSSWRGIVSGQPLDASDFTNFKLLPGANTIACFITGTTTGVSAVMNWQPRYWSVDGTAT